jgi:adenosylhomocysteine nucleosidase
VGRTVEVAWAGIGCSRAQEAADVLIGHGATLLLAVGFAGALTPVAKVGDIVLATVVRDTKAERSWPSDAALLHALRERSPLERGGLPPLSAQRRNPDNRSTSGSGSGLDTPGVHSGMLLTSSRIIATATEKLLLGEETGALAVDMESAAVLRRAAEAGVPALALRAISDRADESLPLDFELCFDSHGQFHLARLLLLLARHPRAVGPLTRVGRQSASAGRSLTGFLGDHLPRLVSTAASVSGA